MSARPEGLARDVDLTGQVDVVATASDGRDAATQVAAADPSVVAVDMALPESAGP